MIVSVLRFPFRIRSRGCVVRSNPLKQPFSISVRALVVSDLFFVCILFVSVRGSTPFCLTLFVSILVCPVIHMTVLLSALLVLSVCVCSFRAPQFLFGQQALFSFSLHAMFLFILLVQQ